MIPERHLNIPLNFPSLNGYRELPIKENNEPLVPLGLFSPYWDIYTDAIYFGERNSSPYRENRIDGSFLTMFVRKSVADALRNTQESLRKMKPGSYLAVLDGYRSYEVQKSLFNRYLTALSYRLPNMPYKELVRKTALYVSEPSLDPKKPSTHETGGSVDVYPLHLPRNIDQEVIKIDRQLRKLKPNDWKKTYPLQVRRYSLISRFGGRLDLPTRFDYGREEAALNYLLKQSKARQLSDQEKEALENVDLLYTAMTSAGFQPLESEWWHYNHYKTQMGAKLAGIPFAEFGPAVLTPRDIDHENMRYYHWLTMKQIREGSLSGDVDPRLAQIFELMKTLSDQLPPWEETSIPKAEIILP